MFFFMEGKGKIPGTLFVAARHYQADLVQSGSPGASPATRSRLCPSFLRPTALSMHWIGSALIRTPITIAGAFWLKDV